MAIKCQFCHHQVEPLMIDIDAHDPCDVTILGECVQCGAIVVDQAGEPLAWSAPYVVTRILDLYCIEEVLWRPVH